MVSFTRSGSAPQATLCAASAADLSVMVCAALAMTRSALAWLWRWPCGVLIC